MTQIRDGQRVLDTLGNGKSGMTAGRAYDVIGVIEGHSGCGPQTWVKVVTDDGSVVGFDPDRFIVIEPQPPGADKAQRSLDALLTARREVLDLMRGISSDGAFAHVHGRLVAIRNGIDRSLALQASDPPRIKPEIVILLRGLKQTGVISKERQPDLWSTYSPLIHIALAVDSSSPGKLWDQLVISRLGENLLAMEDRAMRDAGQTLEPT